ncbi:eCIS core domain-containing protein [Arthrobacter sp. H14-L1]|uniref:eCIS core domain-containing protein n=1 Tax=Arthrobacter sp. H14-L1 TaxID=2996697 RepID=UPI00226E663F|nr:DUF4157 domain-containing protein [Arthrobacter sp. H14-L1]MCY0906008.1 DUF4157 domain-containing protein [Arthrobacter sp. H14-L1]
MSCRQGLSCPPTGLRTESAHTAAEAQADRFAHDFTPEPMAAPAGPLAHLLSMPSFVPSVGTPLPARIRPGLEERTGVDLSAVRLHPQPADLAGRRGQNRAFSTGPDIVLGTPLPHTGSQQTLAHEVAHVVQRGGGGRGLTDLSGGPGQLVQGDGGLTDRDAQLIRDWLTAPGADGTGPGLPQSDLFANGSGHAFPPMQGPTLTFPFPGQAAAPRHEDSRRVAICNTNCHQTPQEQRQEAARRAEEAHQAALRRAWPGLQRAQSTPELDKQGQSIQDDIDASRIAEGQLRVQMFDAAIGSGRRSGGSSSRQLDDRIRDSWLAAEQAAMMIDALYRVPGTVPVPPVITDPLRPWFVAFYASVSRLFRQLDTDDKQMATAMGRFQLLQRPVAASSGQPCPGGCHSPSTRSVAGMEDPFPSPVALPIGNTVLPSPLLDTAPGPREIRLQQAATAVQEANSQASWAAAADQYRWATDQVDELLRNQVQALGGQEELLQNFSYSQEIHRRQQQFLLANPEALKVQAVFFPKDDVKEGYGPEAKPVAKAIPWNFYLVRTPVVDTNHVPTGFEWALHDLTATKGGDRTLRTRHQLTAIEALAQERLGNSNILNVDPPRTIFEELNHRDFFPEGQLYWRWPISKQSDSIETTAPRPFWEWVALVGIAIAVIGSMVFAPFSTPALIAFAVGTGLTAGARYMRLQEMKEHGVWTQADSNRFYWEIAQDVLAAVTMGVGRIAIVAAEAGNVLRAASAAKVWFALRRVEAGVQVVNIGITTVDLIGKFRGIRDSRTMTKEQKDAAYNQLATQAMITGVLTYVAFRGDRDLLAGRPLLHLTPDTLRPGRFVATLSTVGAKSVLTETATLSSARLRQRPQALEEEFHLSQTMTRRGINDEQYDLEVLLSNGHAWRRQRGTKRWCRFSDDPLCLIFGEGGGHHIEVFPAERKARQGFWSGVPGCSEFTPNNVDALRRTGGAPIVYIDGYPDLTPFAVQGGVVLLPRATIATRSRDVHNRYADRSFAQQRGWLTPAGAPDVARVEALRADPANPLTWHHVEFDNIMLLVPRSIHEVAQHAGGYARQ